MIASPKPTSYESLMSSLVNPLSSTHPIPSTRPSVIASEAKQSPRKWGTSMRPLFWVFALLVAALLALFAVSNRAGVALSLWPLPFLVEAPLYLIALGGALLGFVAGELAAWIAASRRGRRVARPRR